MTSNPGYVLLIDSNAPWVRSLFSRLPGVLAGGQVVRALQVHTLSYWVRNQGRLPSKACGEQGILDRRLVIPGWKFTSRYSVQALVITVNRVMRQFGKPQAIVYSLPQYAGVAERFADSVQAYYAHDPFPLFPGWDRSMTEALEKRMLDACSCAFAVSRQLVEDLQKRTRTPVYYSPNAVSSEFVRALDKNHAPVPEELARVPGKIVGCIGQLHPEAYDWHLIAALAAKFPSTTFVFVGTKLSENGPAGAEMRRTLNLPNVRWLGAKPHAGLPQYLMRFDICLNPLAVNAHSNRRSLLRLYDYLATSKPILSTAVREAGEHEGKICVGKDTSECVALLGDMLRGACQVDALARRRYIERNTWECRAAEFWGRIKESCASEVEVAGSNATQGRA